MSFQKTARKVISALLFSILLLFGAQASAADVWRNPAAYPVGMDTWFGSVYNKSAQHDYRNRIGGWGDYYFTLLRFDLSGLPQTATSVKIWRYSINEGTPTGINWYRVGDPWQAGTVTYDNFPFLSLHQLFSTPPPNPGVWYTTDITNLYNQWRQGTTVLNQGVLMVPAFNDNRWASFYSSKQGGGMGPWLQVTYTPQSNDSVIKLKWPLSTSYASRVVTHGFGEDWAGGTYCPAGVIKKHNGVDYAATKGVAVYAPEDGVVKDIFFISSQWASRIVIEHNHPVSGKYTTVLMHIVPLTSLKKGSFVPKGLQVANVADLGSNTHFHFGLRIGAYNSLVSGLGAMPQAACTDPGNTYAYPAFPENFKNPSIVPVFYHPLPRQKQNGFVALSFSHTGCFLSY